MPSRSPFSLSVWRKGQVVPPRCRWELHLNTHAALWKDKGFVQSHCEVDPRKRGDELASVPVPSQHLSGVMDTFGSKASNHLTEEGIKSSWLVFHLVGREGLYMKPFSQRLQELMFCSTFLFCHFWNLTFGQMCETKLCSPFDVMFLCFTVTCLSTFLSPF